VVCPTQGVIGQASVVGVVAPIHQKAMPATLTRWRLTPCMTIHVLRFWCPIVAMWAEKTEQKMKKREAGSR
jgi:hypothetical protein